MNDAIDAQKRDAFVNRLFESGLGFVDLVAVHLGERLGLYRALADGGAATAGELAQRTGTHERYVREWLEQQAVSGVLEVARPSADAGARRYALSREHAEVLLDADSLAWFAPFVRFFMGVMPVVPALLDAFRTGRGVPWTAYGADGREGQAGANRPLFLRVLGSDWLPSIKDLHTRLQTDPPARVADVACGAGWSSIGIARAYPRVRVDGIDVDEASIELARGNVAAAGLADRVTMQARDAGDPALAGRYDLVTIFESLHDMSRPVDVLGKMRAMLAAGGSVLVMDERVEDEFTAPGSPTERLFYGFSVVCCLPVGLSEQPSAATGTVMRTSTLRRYAKEAGFTSVEVLPIEHDLFRFYRLRP